MANQGAAVPLARVGSPQASATGQGVPLARTTAQAGPSRHQGAPPPLPPPEKWTPSPEGKGNEEVSDSEDDNSPATIINNQINTVIARPLRVNTPDAYRGERDLLDAFLLQCDIYIGFSGEKLFPTEVDKVLWVTTYLRGRALAWMQVYTQDLLTYQATPEEQQPLTRQIFGDYAVFKAQIRKIFGEIDPVRKAERELRGLRQSGSAAKYAAPFRMHLMQTGWDEATLTTLFYFGLMDEIKDEIARSVRPTTMEGMIDMAILIDQRMQERREERRGKNPMREIQFRKKNKHGHQKQQKSYSRSEDYGDPMELDATQVRKKPKKDKAQLRRENRCFECGKQGHIARFHKKSNSEAKGKGLTKQLNATNQAEGFDKELEEEEQENETEHPQGRVSTGFQLPSTVYFPSSIWEGIQYNEEMSDAYREFARETMRQQEILRMLARRHNQMAGQINRDILATLNNILRLLVQQGYSNEAQELIRTQLEEMQANGILPYDEEDRSRITQALLGPSHPDHANLPDDRCLWDGCPRHNRYGVPWDELPFHEEDNDPILGTTRRGWHSIEPDLPPDEEEEDLPEIDPQAAPEHTPATLESMNPLEHLQQLETALLVAIQMAGELLEEAGEDWPQDEAEPDMAWFYGPSESGIEDDGVLTDGGDSPPSSMFLMATNGGSQQIFLEVELHSRKLRAMIDLGATGNFLATRMVKSLGLPTQKRKKPYTLEVVDGTLLSDKESGLITSETPLLDLTSKGYFERIKLDIVPLGRHQIILGVPWLRRHNPSIDWKKGTVQFRKETTEEGFHEICALSKKGKTEIVSNSSPMTDALEKVVPILYHKYLWLFEELLNEQALPVHKPYDHAIVLEPEDAMPPFGPIYQLSVEHLQSLKEFIDRNLAKGFIRKSNSPCSSPVLFVGKPDGKWRLCVDFRRLNAMTKRDCYTVPLIAELQDRVAGAKYYTKLDIREAYYRIRIKEGDEWKTVFRTRYGLYEFQVLPLGLINAPASFQQVINSILHEYLDVFMLAYLDDILVYSATMKEHTKHVTQVLEKIAESDLYLNPKKCEWHKTEVKYLGFIFSSEGIKADPEKVRAVSEWKSPENLKQVQSFLGFINFYRRLIPGFAEAALPLTRLTRKDVPFEWTDPEEQAFQELKRRATAEPVMAHFNPNREVVLETDASDYAIGACLSQRDDSKRLRPVAYFSRGLTAAEKNYTTGDKELLAIVAALKAWKPYTEGTKYPVIVYSDHKNLTTFTTTKPLNQRQARWSEALASRWIEIHHRKGIENRMADALSRQQEYDIHSQKVAAILKSEGGTLVPSATEVTIVDDEEVPHEELMATIAMVEPEEFVNNLKEGYQKDTFAKEILKGQEDEDFQVDEQGLIRFKGLLFIPNSLAKNFIKEQHEMPAHGHQGITKTMDRLKDEYFIHQLTKKVKEVVKECSSCAKNRDERHRPYGKLNPLAPKGRAWASGSMDFIVKLPPSIEPSSLTVCDSIWVGVDRLTKMAHFVPTTETITAERLAYLVEATIIANHGLPEDFVSDRDKLFTSKFWTSLMARIGTKQKMSTAFHPQSDGQTERTNQTLEKFLRNYVNFNQDDWVTYLPMAQFAYNSAVSETTGLSPFFANYGYQPVAFRVPETDTVNSHEAIVRAKHLVALQENLSQDIEFNNRKMAYYANKRRGQEPSLKEGDKVYLLRRNIDTNRPSDKLDHRKIGPFEIVKALSHLNYELKLPKGSRLHPVFHVSLLEPAHGDPATDEGSVLKPKYDEPSYTVEKILDHRMNHDQIWYLIKCKDFSEDENSWEPATNLSCPKLLKAYHLRSRRDVRKLRGKKGRHEDPRETQTD